ncbi:pyridoxamine 5'-phosphate oxidase family protein [Desulfoferula mesophila]|uniref:pyridoxamine 5'-phosphate oxidase family protein n=1 Tax=Desulfoferula mesophila TaxID=3058419 RepID=UPI0030D42FFD
MEKFVHLNLNPPGQQAQELEQHLRDMAASQLFAVLSTVGEKQPYASLVAFAASTDLARIYFSTSRTTRKFNNLQRNPRAAILMDNRSNQVTDLRLAAAATAVGKVEAIGPDKEAVFKQVFLAKRPHMGEFLDASNTARLCLHVDAYYVVSRFQSVFEFRVVP